MTKPPIIVGVDLSREPDRSAIMRWDGEARLVHEPPAGAAVTFYGGRAIVVTPNGPPYAVDMDTGVTTPILENTERT